MDEQFKGKPFIIKGPPPLMPIPNIPLGDYIHYQLSTRPPNNIALVEACTNTKLTYNEILEKSQYLAIALKSRGVQKDSVIAFCSENNLEFIVAVIACLYLGAIVAPVNHLYTLYELEHCLNITQPKLIFCSLATHEKILKLKSKLEYIQNIIILNGHIPNYKDVDSLQKNQDISKFELAKNLNTKEQVGFIMCSSGTTGLPKGVMLTHENVVIVFLGFLNEMAISGIKPSISVGILPFFHAYGLFLALLSIVNNNLLISFSRFDSQIFLSAIEKYQATSLFLVPPLIIFLTKSPIVKNYNLKSVEKIYCGAAPMSKELVTAFKKRMGIDKILQAYGLTESTLGVTSMIGETDKEGSVGKVTRYAECMICDPETRQSLGPNQVGEIWIKGPKVMKGYANNPEATKAMITKNGWLMTGDLGYYDRDEYFFIVGRIKEIIKYKGYQVAPAEIEAILLNHPDIMDVGVVGKPDIEAGEVPLAFVVKKPSVNLDEKQIQKYLNDFVSPQKRLRGGVRFIDKIPKNPSGKILRNELKKLILDKKSKL